MCGHTMSHWPITWSQEAFQGKSKYFVYLSKYIGNHQDKKYFIVLRRVHITEATLKHLNKAYEVEEGNGHLRDQYLKELTVQTYLVIDPRVSCPTIAH